MKKLVRFAYLAAILVTAAALLFSVGRWWARRHWLAEKARMLASGEISTLAAAIPPPLPEADNFAAIPRLRAQWVEIEKERGPLEIFPDAAFDPIPELNLTRSSKNGVGYRMAVYPEAPDLAEALRDVRHLDPLPGEAPAATILRTLEPLQEILGDLADGLRRPGCRFPVQYARSYFAVQPSSAFFRRLGQLFGLRAAARLELGQIDAAAEDVAAMLRLGRHFRQDPGLLRLGIGAAVTTDGTRMVWLGLSRNLWRAEHLQSFSRILDGTDYFADFARAARLEFVVAADLWEQALEEGTRFRDLRNLASVVSDRTVRFAVGDAMYYAGLTAFARASADLQKSLPATRPTQFQPAAFEAAMGEIERRSARWDGTLISLSLPKYERSLQRYLMAQAKVELCQSALQLEALRLVDGRYPAQPPAGMPNDFMSGRPRVYEASADGQRFRLRGTPWRREGDPELPAKDNPWEWYSNLGGPAAWE
ncbi:MAG: hypothetical protein JSR82_18430 [Verrucomicrobia bacterium]|nr:hypothetical protein [Verrucomicrobiota bacterium]